jgi:serine/threonine-protein kinase
MPMRCSTCAPPGSCCSRCSPAAHPTRVSARQTWPGSVDREVPPPSRLVPGLPAFVDQVVARATDRDPPRDRATPPRCSPSAIRTGGRGRARRSDPGTGPNRRRQAGHRANARPGRGCPSRVAAEGSRRRPGGWPTSCLRGHLSGPSARPGTGSTGCAGRRRDASSSSPRWSSSGCCSSPACGGSRSADTPTPRR